MAKKNIISLTGNILRIIAVSISATLKSKEHIMPVANNQSIRCERYFLADLNGVFDQPIGSLSCNPHFALFQPDRRWDIFLNASNHWGMVTYNFFRNFFFRSLIRAHTGSFANVLQAVWPVSIKLGQILCCQKTGHGP